MYKRVESFEVSRDFITNPLISQDDYSRIRIQVTLYDINHSSQFEVVRSHHEAKGLPDGKVDVTERKQDSQEVYLDLEEAFNAFSVQCVKAFTAQVTWYNSKDLEAKQKGL